MIGNFLKSKFIVVLLCFSIIIPSTVFATSRQSYESQKNNIKKEINEQQSELNSKKNESTQVQGEINNLDGELTSLEDKLRQLLDQIANKEKEITTTQEDIEKAKQKQESQYKALKNRIKYMYELGNSSYLELLFKAKDLTDFFNRMEYVKDIMLYDKNLFTDLDKTRNEIEQKEIALNDEKDNLVVLKNNQEEQKHTLTIKRNEKKVLLTSIKDDQNKIQQSLQDLKQSEQEVDNIIKRLLEEERRAQQAQQQAKYQGGKLGWPLPSNYTRISSPYGWRPDPFTGQRWFHKGIDIPAPTGTKVFAAEAGTVMYAGYVSGYGKTVMINHGGLITLYAHNSKLIVQTGQKVVRGQNISLVGSTGRSTGPHCHFGVQVNGQYVSPWNYLGK